MLPQVYSHVYLVYAFHSGVAQGSIIGPGLLLMCINDMVHNVSETTQISLFADNANIIRDIQSVSSIR